MKRNGQEEENTKPSLIYNIMKRHEGMAESRIREEINIRAWMEIESVGWKPLSAWNYRRGWY